MTAQDLHGAVANHQHGFVGGVFRQQCGAGGRLIVIKHPGGFPCHQAQAVNFNQHFRQHKRDGLPLTDGFAKGLAVASVIQRVFVGASCHADCQRRQCHLRTRMEQIKVDAVFAAEFGFQADIDMVERNTAKFQRPHPK